MSRYLKRANGIVKEVKGCVWCDHAVRDNNNHTMECFKTGKRIRRKDTYHIEDSCPLPTEPIQEDPRL